MESSARDAENNEIPDKITIKVKVPGEDYHDVFIDRSAGQDVGRQLFNQLASITGIPLHKIDLLVIEANFREPITAIYRNDGTTRDERINGSYKINHGACYVVTLRFHDFKYAPHVDLFLYNPTRFDEKRCTPWCCQTIDGRAFLNRRLEFIKNGGPKFYETRDYFRGDLVSTFRAMNIWPYMEPCCSLFNIERAQYFTHPYYYYPRTHG